MSIIRIAACPLLAAAVLAGGCGPSVEVTSTYGPGVRFSETAHLYAWAPGSDRTSGEGRPENVSLDGLIREAVNAHLAARGYRQVGGDGKPDFLIDYAVSKATRADKDDFTKPLYKVGRLEVTALNPATSKLIWKGEAETRLDPSAPPDTNRKQLDTLVGKLINQVPAARSKS